MPPITADDEHERRLFVTPDDFWRVECSCGVVIAETDDAGEFAGLFAGHLAEVSA